MALWPALRSQGENPEYTQIGTSPGLIQVTSSASTANTKGGWFTINTTAFDCDGLLICYGPASANVTHLIDIGVGTAGSEQVVVTLHCSSEAGLTHWFYIPMTFPSGTRVAARNQVRTGTSISCYVAAMPIMGAPFVPAPGSSIATWGADTADSGGVTLDAGATVNTYGAIVQLTASTQYPVTAVCGQLGGAANTAPTAGSGVVQLLVGGSGSETPICEWGFRIASGSDNFGPLPSFWIPCSIPAGSRISARWQSTVNDAVDRICEFVAYGLEI